MLMMLHSNDSGPETWDCRAGVGPDCYRENTENGTPAGLRPAGKLISMSAR